MAGSVSLATTFEPMSPVPPMTTSFMEEPSFLLGWPVGPGSRGEHAGAVHLGLAPNQMPGLATVTGGSSCGGGRTFMSSV